MNWINRWVGGFCGSGIYGAPVRGANRLWRMMGIAILIAVASGVSGLYASFYANVSSGASIVLACTGFFFLAWAWQALRHRIRHEEHQEEEHVEFAR